MHVIRANQHINILFKGDVDSLGSVILGCYHLQPDKRIYFRLSGNLLSVKVDNNTTIIPRSYICKANQYTLEFSSTFHDIDVPIGEWNSSEDFITTTQLLTLEAQ